MCDGPDRWRGGSQVRDEEPEIHDQRLEPAKEQRETVTGPLMCDPVANSFQAVTRWHDAVSSRVQRTAQALAVFGFRFRHDSRSRTVRSADMPRAV